jgi:hypothetical protein
MSIKRSLPWLVLCGSLSSVGLFVAPHVQREIVVKGPAGVTERIHLDRLSAAEFVRFEDDHVSRLSWSTPFTFVVFLSGVECSSCLEEAEEWSRLVELAPARLRVLAVAVHTTREDVQAFLDSRRAGYEFLRFRSPVDEAATGIGLVTPLKVLMDAGGRVRLAAGPLWEKRIRREFYSRVNKIVVGSSPLAIGESLVERR